MLKNFLLLFSTFTCLFSQTTILVSDSTTSEKLFGATIYIDHKAVGTTNIDGIYISDLIGNHELKISFVGYNTIIINQNFTGKETIKVDLQATNKELVTTVISSSKYERKPESETVSIDVLSASLIKNTNSVDAAEALNRNPGVTINDGQMSVRGGSGYSYGIGSRVNFLLDGLPIMSGDLGAVDWNLIPIENIDQIEVMKSASSVFYGSGSLNGVANVITGFGGKTPKTSISFYTQLFGDPPRGETKWWNSADQPFSTGLFFNHSRALNDNMDLVVGGHLNLDKSFLQNNNQNRGRLNVKWRWKIPKVKGLIVGVNTQFMFTRLTRLVLWRDAASDIFESSFNIDDKLYFLTIDPNVKYYDKKGNKFSLNTRYYRRFRYGFGGDKDAIVNNIMADFQYQRKFLKNMFTATAGTYVNYGWMQNNLFPDSLVVNNDTFVLKNFETIAAALYAQIDFSYRRWNVTAGVRYELNGANLLVESGIPVFRGGINFRAAKKTFLRGSWGQSYRLPSLGERFINAQLIDNFNIVANPNLIAERGWNAEIGVKQLFNIGENWTGSFDLAIYWMEYQNMIDYTFGAFPQIGFKAFNVSRARTMGFEMSIQGKGKIGPVQVNSYLSYNYSFPGNLSNAKSLENVGNYLQTMFSNFATPLMGDIKDSTLLSFRNRHIFRGDIELEWNNISIGTTLYYTGLMERVDPNFIIIELAQPNFITPYINSHKGIMGDFVADVRMSYQFRKYPIKVNFIIKNVGNLEYVARPGIMNPIRSFNLRVDFNF